MGKKDKDLAAKRKAYQEKFGYQSQVAIPPGMTLPPGFVNLGNSCFLNSTLQSLTATPLLQALLTFNPPPDLEHERDVYPARSPALTNSRGPPGVKKDWERGMPICDAFLRFEDDAINARQMGKTSLSPRELLGQIGSKYDQYLGYRQQDAHELLRHLLDGMRMEEMDIIKKRNPPPPKQVRKSKNKSEQGASNDRNALPNGSANGPDPPANPQTIEPESDPLMPFADMVFGGALASILVCEGCRHISHTYEDFMDLSLSIKPDDVKERKRGKFKFFHKLRKATTPTPPRTPPPTMTSFQSSPATIPFPSAEIDVSAAPSTIDINGTVVGSTDGPLRDERKVSVGAGEGVTTQPQARLSAVQISTEEGHDRDENSSSTSMGARIGRRVSLQGWKKKDKDKSREREKSKERLGKDAALAEKDAGIKEEEKKSRPSSPERNAGSRATSPVRKNETVYLRRVLADIGGPAPSNPLALLKGTVDGILKDPFTTRPSVDDAWIKLSTGRGSITDALRSFTAVEMLEGDNAFACRRCWKIAHGVPVGRARKELRKANGKSKESVGTSSTGSTDDSSDSDSDSDSTSGSDSESASEDQRRELRPELSMLRPASTSGLGAEPEEWARDTAFPRPSSVPVVEDRMHNGPIPVIEMTSPDAERARPFPEIDTTSLSAPKLARTTSAGTGSSETTQESTASGQGPVIVAPVPRTPIALRGVTLPPVPRSQQYVHRRALKRYLIATPPPVLVIHLKRFQQVAGAGTLLFGSLRKLDDFVAFPEVLDIAPFVAPNREDYGMGKAKTKALVGGHGGKDKANGVGWFGRGKEKDTAVKYRLYAVVVHSGSMIGGHYIAYIALPPQPVTSPDTEDAPGGTEDAQAAKDKDKKGEDAKEKDKSKRQWVYISDTTVRPVSFEEVSKAKAYLCFYERFWD